MRQLIAITLLVGAALWWSGPGLTQEARVPAPAQPITSAEAFGTPYGARIVEVVGAALAASADRACLASRGRLAPGREQAADWLIRYGQRAAEREAAFDQRAALETFVAWEGAGAPTELDALARRPLARELVALSAQRRLDAAAERIVQALDHHLVQQELVLARRLGQVLDAPEVVALSDAREQAEIDAVRRFSDTHGADPELRRFIHLLAQWRGAVLLARNVEPQQGFEGIVEELRAHCIGPQ